MMIKLNKKLFKIAKYTVLNTDMIQFIYFYY